MDIWIQQAIVIITLIGLMVFLFKDKVKPAIVFFGAIIVFILTGILSPEDFLKGFSNKPIATILILILITAGLRKQFGFVRMTAGFLSTRLSPKAFKWRLTVLVASMSSVMNNTPVVAAFIPVVHNWAKRKGSYPSKFLITLSFSAILGGMITLIGTSTNLVLNGLLINAGEAPLTFLDFLIPGVLVTITGLIFLNTVGQKLLPEHVDPLDRLLAKAREYVVETEILNNSPLAGQTIFEADLRKLKDLFLIEIIRNGRAMNPVSPEEVLMEGDILVFAGKVQAITELISERKGLKLIGGSDTSETALENLTEVVIPTNSFLEGKVVKESNFREKFNSGIIAVHRRGERLTNRVGELKLEAGDLLLLNSGPGLDTHLREAKDLILVSGKPITKIVNGKFPKLFLLFSGLLLALSIFGVLPFFNALFLIFASQLILKHLKIEDLKRELDLDLISILVSALALGEVLISTQTGELLANSLINWLNPLGVTALIIGLYGLTLFLTNFVTNVAAISIVFPIAFSMVQSDAAVSTEIYLAIAFAASCAFMTPFGYQTNLMVMGPGNYKAKDFVKIGLPLTIVYSLTFFIYLFFK